MMRAAVTILSALALLGCGPKVQTVWRHAELGSDEELNRDHYECRNRLEEALPKSEAPEAGEDASAWAFTQAVRYDAARDGHYESCMEARGWYQVEVPAPSE